MRVVVVLSPQRVKTMFLLDVTLTPRLATLAFLASPAHFPPGPPSAVVAASFGRTSCSLRGICCGLLKLDVSCVGRAGASSAAVAQAAVETSYANIHFIPLGGGIFFFFFFYRRFMR